MEDEEKILSRFLYKNNYQHRRGKYHNHVIEVDRYLKRITARVDEKWRPILPLRSKDIGSCANPTSVVIENISKVISTSQSDEYFHSYVKLLKKTKQVVIKASASLELMLVQTIFMPYTMTAIAMFGRIFVLIELSLVNCQREMACHSADTLWKKATTQSKNDRHLPVLFSQSVSPLVVSLAVLLDGADRSPRNKVFLLLTRDPVFKRQLDLDKKRLRQWTLERYKRVVAEGIFHIESESYSDDFYESMLSAFYVCDNNLGSIHGVQYYLFCEAIRLLGTEIHRKYLIPAQKFQISGCFALTELGHGSNTKGVETVATYVPDDDEFVLHSPTVTSQKYWIGLAANVAQYSIVWAQLIVRNTNYGLHAFLVRLRDNDGHVVDNIDILDCGTKSGLNGIDNGRIMFRQLRIPKESLLNRFGTIDSLGNYASKFSDKNARFAAQMVNLSRGRVNMANHSTIACKIALLTTIRYANTRRQFLKDPNDTEETLLLDYPVYQLRIFPLVAITYAHHFMTKSLIKRYGKYVDQGSIEAKLRRDNHILSAGVKAISTWHQVHCLQQCREACGGMGLKASNVIGLLRADHDVQVTYEGDNTVLLLNISKPIYDILITKKHQFSVNVTLCDKETLLDDNYQMTLFAMRLDTSVAVIEHALKGRSVDDSWDEIGGIRLDLSRAYIEYCILEEFVKAEKICRETSKILGLLRSLYALHKLDNDVSFLRNGSLSMKTKLNIHESVLRLCKEIRPYILDIVEAFDIPDDVLGSIARDWTYVNDFENKSSTEQE